MIPASSTAPAPGCLPGPGHVLPSSLVSGIPAPAVVIHPSLQAHQGHISTVSGHIQPRDRAFLSMQGCISLPYTSFTFIICLGNLSFSTFCSFSECYQLRIFVFKTMIFSPKKRSSQKCLSHAIDQPCKGLRSICRHKKQMSTFF